MKNFKVIDYRIINKFGRDVTTTFFSHTYRTRRAARVIKNAMNILDKLSAPHRIAEVRITK